MPLRFDFLVEKLKRRKAAGAKLAVAAKAEQQAKVAAPAHAESPETKRRKTA